MTAATQTSSEYRRAARRLRWIHRDDPQRRARSLRELSSAFDRGGQVAPAAGNVESVRRFARSVASELEGSTLLYSNRLKLLRAAQRHGIRRFDANLIIAAVQERVRGGEPRVRGSEFGAQSSNFGKLSRAGFRVQERAVPRDWLMSIGLVLIVQAAILVGACYSLWL